MGVLFKGVYSGIWRLYRDNAQENGNYNLGFRV